MPQGSVEDDSVGSLLRNRPFRYLLGGHAVSSLGDWVATFGLMLFVRDLTRGSSIEGLAISGILGFRILPALIAAPIASTIADRFDRRRTMIATDIVRAGLIAIGSVHAEPRRRLRDRVRARSDEPDLPPRTRRRSSRGSSRPSKLAGANGLIMILQWGTIPIAGGLVVAADAASQALVERADHRDRSLASAFALPFFFDALTFLVSAWAILALPRARRARHAKRDRDSRRKRAARDRARHDRRRPLPAERRRPPRT